MAVNRGELVADFGNPVRLTPLGLVVLPLAIITLVVGLVILVVVASDQFLLVSPAPILVAGLLVYAATLVILGRNGSLNVRELETLGITDSLSQLPNRRALHDEIGKASLGDSEIALALVDLDSFKEVNDHYGHGVGDQLIQRCAELLRESCEPEAKCFRLGGDEFAVLMIGPVAGTILEGICRRLLDTLSKPIDVGPNRIRVGASVGLARSTPTDRLPSSELLRCSDIAMYMSKRNGKMRCTWFSKSFDQRREAARQIEDEMRAGLSNDEFTVEYQPLVHADTGLIVAVEALMRWHRKDDKGIGPSVFIPIAEESGLINEIGLFSLRRAISDALRWPDIILSVNISATQLRNPEFPIKLGEVLEETGFPPERLELEITETGLILDPVVAERTLGVIKGFGVHVALDDFGTGYASIGFLRQFRFEKLKIDRSLVTEAGSDEGSRAMMVSSVALARALKMGVTAEGVETTEQADMVRTVGCDQIQGWLFYKAMPAEEIDRLVSAQAAAIRAALDEPNPEASGDAA